MITLTTRRVLLPAVISAAVCCSVAGCGSDSGPSNVIASPAPDVAAESADSETGAAIDACSLISAADISALLGVAVEGRSSTTAADQPGCFWENPDSSESVSLELGAPDTAINNTVPPPEEGFPELRTPGPDGMMFLGTGSVEFAAGRRSNIVQVAVMSLLGEKADAAAVDLARKVSAQL